MPIEHSHGKARPTLPRSSDLATVPAAATADDRRRQRDALGRFAAGNDAGCGRGLRQSTRRMLGSARGVSDAEALTVGRDAERLFAATLRELPNTGSTVRQLAALYCRHAALSAFWSSRASKAGLGTAKGVSAAETATKHGQRAERLAVTMLDVSTRMARSQPADDAPDWLR